jgi:hypothetical protein
MGRRRALNDAWPSACWQPRWLVRAAVTTPASDVSVAETTEDTAPPTPGTPAVGTTDTPQLTDPSDKGLEDDPNGILTAGFDLESGAGITFEPWASADRMRLLLVNLYGTLLDIQPDGSFAAGPGRER